MLISKFDLYKAEWLDLVFEKRNKNYGAYELRQHYSERMIKAMAITLSTLVAGAVAVIIVTHHQPDTVIEKTVQVTLPPPPVFKSHTVTPPPAAPHHIEPLKPTQAGPSVAIPTHVVPENVPTDPPTIAEIAKSTVGPETKPGTGTGENIMPVNGGNGGGGVIEAPSNEPLQVVEVEPEPIGGMAAWSKFLQKNLRYPNTENEGRVILTFVVERDGSLSNIQVVKSVSPEIDAEAVRVLKIAPKWKPGVQSGQTVRVQYTLPINFQFNHD